MSLHLAAAAIIALVLVWHFAKGERSYALQVLATEREVGRNSLSNRSHRIVWFCILSFLFVTAVALLAPASPLWLEGVFGFLFVIFGLLDFFIQRGKRPGGYFAITIGALILAGIF